MVSQSLCPPGTVCVGWQCACSAGAAPQMTGRGVSVTCDIECVANIHKQEEHGGGRMGTEQSPKALWAEQTSPEVTTGRELEAEYVLCAV